MKAGGIMKIMLAVFMLAFAVLGMGVDDARDLCREAEKCFDKGNELSATDQTAAMEQWRMAAARLEKVAREADVANGPLFYNLGNIYFRLGDMGRAILNFRKAQKFTPNDVNLKRNLAYARRNCQDSVQEEESKKVMKTLFFWHYDFSLAIREVIFIICFCAFWLLCALRLKLKGYGTGIGLVACGILAVVVASSMMISEYSHRQASGVILSAEVVGRTGNSEAYERSFQEPLHAGTEFDLLETRGNWMEIRLADGKTCWIPADAAEML